MSLVLPREAEPLAQSLSSTPALPSPKLGRHGAAAQMHTDALTSPARTSYPATRAWTPDTRVPSTPPTPPTPPPPTEMPACTRRPRGPTLGLPVPAEAALG